MELLPTDEDLHRRESEWLSLIQVVVTQTNSFALAQLTLSSLQRYETLMIPYEHYAEEDFEDGLKILDLDYAASVGENLLGLEFIDENGVNNLADVESDEEEGEDYELFAEMLSEGRKAIEERKKLWEATGDSFILDHFQGEAHVVDWVKENVQTTEPDLNISTMYGNQCKKKKKLASTFLDVDKEEARTLPANESCPPMEIAVPRTPTTTKNPSRTALSKSESTYNRRRNAPSTAIKRGMFQSVKRLSTVPESPGRVVHGSPIRRSYSISDLKLPRQRTVIYSPMNPIVQEKFKAVLTREWFDPTKILIYEPPSDSNLSSDSGDDLFLTCKRKYGGKVHEI